METPTRVYRNPYFYPGAMDDMSSTSSLAALLKKQYTDPHCDPASHQGG